MPRKRAPAPRAPANAGKSLLSREPKFEGISLSRANTSVSTPGAGPSRKVAPARPVFGIIRRPREPLPGDEVTSDEEVESEDVETPPSSPNSLFDGDIPSDWYDEIDASGDLYEAEDEQDTNNQWQTERIDETSH